MKRFLLALVASTLVSACAAHEREAVRPTAPCPGGIWVPGHYGSNGRWHPSNWRCTGMLDEEVVVLAP